jgi:hypothetical protein
MLHARGRVGGILSTWPADIRAFIKAHDAELKAKEPR